MTEAARQMLELTMARKEIVVEIKPGASAARRVTPR
jgi:hypothetical protein